MPLTIQYGTARSRAIKLAILSLFAGLGFSNASVSVGMEAKNLIVNGNFEAGNTDFSTDLNFDKNLEPEGNYFITTTPKNHHRAAASIGDHTSGKGKMMIINGTSTKDQIVWKQTDITVTPNTQYDFAAYLSSWTTGSPAVLQFSINGTKIGALEASGEPEWEHFFATWNSGSASKATISILNDNISAGGNDFALDDIYFGTPVFTKPVEAFAPPCSANEVAHWAFEGNTDDVSGNGHHAETKGSANYTVGYKGRGLSLDGKTQALIVSKPIPKSIFATGDYTISGAFRTPGNSKLNQDIFSALHGGHGILIELGQNGRLRFLHRLPFGNTGGINLHSKPGVNLNDNKFHTFSATTGDRKLKLYVDGELQEQAEEKSEFNKDLNVYIGMMINRDGANNRFFKGVLDEIRIYNASLACDILSANDKATLNKIPVFSNMMTAAVSGKVVPAEKKGAYYFKRDGQGANIKKNQPPTKLMLVKSGDKVSFRDADKHNPNEWVSIVDIADTGCHSHILSFTTNPDKKAEFYVRAPKMGECSESNKNFCVKPEDKFVSYESVSEPGHYIRHCGYKIGLQKPSTNPNNTEIGDMTWRMQPAK